jgi:hypothetical protein
MVRVLQAHMPGNYELYDLSSSKAGPAICKDCWEKANKRTTRPLDTVWVSSKGGSMIWWLCQDHAEKLKAKKSGNFQFVKLVKGVAPRPEAC